ncbi:MAG: MOSC N-terminal beta barrel domain-containing protein [Blastocatellia bacterium]|nr:MOSC N-terminal beta barrel domain-containing protein [Blastocatellia bacterium]
MSNGTTIELGRIAGLFRYSIKSMIGAALELATLGWHGLAGDRRFAFCRVANRAIRPFTSFKGLHNAAN